MSADSPQPNDGTPELLARVPGWIAFCILVSGAVALDWWSKSAAFDFHFRVNGLLAESRPAEFFEAGFFNLQIVREYNSGMAFGLLQNSPNAPLYLGIIRAIAVIVLIWMFHRPTLRSGWHPFSLGALTAGAAGNLLDNLFQLEFGHEHSVRDFILISVSNRSFPVFNLADVYVTVGAVTFFLVLARTRIRT